MREDEIRETALLCEVSSVSSGSSNGWFNTALISLRFRNKKGGHLMVPPWKKGSHEPNLGGCAYLVHAPRQGVSPDISFRKPYFHRALQFPVTYQTSAYTDKKLFVRQPFKTDLPSNVVTVRSVDVADLGIHVRRFADANPTVFFDPNPNIYDYFASFSKTEHRAPHRTLRCTVIQ